jgi:hypothetical protein
VAGGADLGVDLKPALKLHLVVAAEGAFVREGEIPDFAGLAGRQRRARG